MAKANPLIENGIFVTLCPVKRFTAIFFLSTYLLSVTELHQLVKFPVLVEHFIEHKGKNQNLSFVDFLGMHYSQQNEKDADYDRDMQLPFKSHDGCSTAFLSAFLHSLPTGLSNKPAPASSCEYSEYSDEFLSQTYLASIWQPPKSC